MSEIDWPAVFPPPSASLSGGTVAPVITSPMETGRTRQRRRFTQFRRTWSVTWDFSLLEYEAFLAFFNHVIDAGTTYFNLSLPIDSEYTPQEVRFQGGMFSDSYKIHERMTVQATLESGVIETNSEAWLYIFETFGGDLAAFMAFEDAFNTFVNVTLPNNHAN